MRRRALCTVLALLFVLSACHNPAADSTDPSSGEPSAARTGAPASAPAETPSPEPTPTPEPPVEFYIRDPSDRSKYVLAQDPRPDDGLRYYIADSEDSSRYVPVELIGPDGSGRYQYEPYIASTLTQEQIDAVLNEVMEEYSATAISVGVIQDGVVTGSGAWGWAVKNERELTADTKLRAASLSKLSVGMSAMAMAEEGLLELDAPLSAYWGEDVYNPYSRAQPSAYSLMTHTSSLMDLETQGGLSNLRGKLRTYWRNMEPGDGGYWYYSNFGFCVLGTTLELASNEVLNDYLQSRFLEPLGVRASIFSGKLEADELASLYNSYGELELSASAQASFAVPTEIGAGAAYYPGGLTISARDLAKLVAILANDGVYDGVRYLSAESVADMETPRFAVDYLEGTWPFEQCLVLRRQSDLMGRDAIYYHTGSAYGVYSLYSYDPDTGDGVVVITVGTPYRRNQRGLYALCADISERLYAEMED